MPGSSPLDGKRGEPTAERQELKAISARVAGKGKVPREEMEAVVLELCHGRYLSLAELSALLIRKPEPLRNKTLTPMVRAGKLRFRHPEQPQHPDQAYTTATEAP